MNIAFLFRLNDSFGGAERRLARVYNEICAENDDLNCDIVIRGCNLNTALPCFERADCDIEKFNHIYVFKSRLIENSQRDVNVAFMNECSRICDRTNIDTNEVLTAMNTKWNALGFQPGLVGGHCIGEDSYYLLKYAKDIKCDTPVLSHGRCLNEDMAAYIADRAVKEMSAVQKDLKRATVLILGITFKENCSDIRNSKVADLIAQLKSYQINPIVTDECANPEAVQEMYGIKLVPFDELPLADCIIIAVGHHAYKTLSMQHLLNMYKKELPDHEKVLLDVKSIFDLETLRASGIRFWRL